MARKHSPRRLLQVSILAPRDQDYFREIILGVSAVTPSRGWLVNLVGHSDHVRWLREVPQDVLIFTGDYWDRTPEDLKQGPVLLAADVDLSDRGVPSVVVDNHAVGKLAANHLIERGLESFAFFGEAGTRWAADRAAGFRDVIAECGLRMSEWFKSNNDPSLPKPEWSGPDAVLPWLQSLPKPVGIFAACDDWGATLTAYCRIAGLRVPEDLAIVSVDNDEFVCQLSVPPLSSVAMPLRRLGTEVGLMLDRLLSGRKLPQEKVVLQPSGVVARRSSDMLAVEDPDVAAALAVIRDHADRPLSVSKILQQVPTYQHRLERGFKRYLGRTMMDEIRRVHLEQAKRLLVSTELPMSEIAERSGFSNQTKFAVAFKRDVGMTPTEYRRRYRTSVVAT